MRAEDALQAELREIGGAEAFEGAAAIAPAGGGRRRSTNGACNTLGGAAAPPATEGPRARRPSVHNNLMGEPGALGVGEGQAGAVGLAGSVVALLRGKK
ncbi:hypothetical protein MNEG_11522 [Monoraphidium neglectum]|uniref:Uncharacterized protein n=1 Tax=Monoraphidium neglectum TaxID=145388 RepID=A0A0D2M595_9CHLO|nr:hypothetical protein MNEG_11522 [Monoraphidium neglectum]KIY96441.1 hypothetical protein MNEG_11522 [Monoraphidium neglectum]|eukprot:XP_013895461.1 hypothetical protein MNEG_11522 [Monoraphidium neglectum]